MEKIILEHPYLAFFAFCVLVEGITTIVKSILNYKLDRKSNTEFGISINGGNNEGKQDL